MSEKSANAKKKLLQHTENLLDCTRLVFKSLNAYQELDSMILAGPFQLGYSVIL